MKSTIITMITATLSLALGTLAFFFIFPGVGQEEIFTRIFFQITTGAYLAFLVWFFNRKAG